MHRNLIIHTSENILVIVEELPLIYYSTDVSTPWRHCNAAEQQNEQINEVMRQITNAIIRARKKGLCQSITKYITEILNTKKILNEQKLERNKTACKYLNN